MLVVGSGWAQSSPPVGAILTLLRGGGYVIVFRHGATHADQADTDPLNLDNVAKQRQLNDKGRADAKAGGDALKAVGVPIGSSTRSARTGSRSRGARRRSSSPMGKG